MPIISYSWPVTHWMLPPDCTELEMDSPDIICSRIAHATAEQKQHFRDRGKIILHTVTGLSALLATDGALLAAMIDATEGHPVDGLSLDEFCLGKYTPAQRTAIKTAIMAYRERYPHMLLHAWVGYCLTTMDGPTVKLLYNLFDWVSPELYIKEGDPITMQVFLRRYRAQVDLSRTLVGLAIHKDYRITETGWLPHLAAQIRRVTALGCAGVAMWAPVHLRDSGERKAVDALLSGAVDK